MMQATKVIISLLGLGLMGVGLLLHIIGLATPVWSRLDTAGFFAGLSGVGANNYLSGRVEITFGLWEVCDNLVCLDLPDETKNDKWRTCQAFSIIGVIFGAAGILIGLFHVAKSIFGSSNNSKLLPTIVVIASSLAFGAIIICIIVWASGIHAPMKIFSLGYSFILSIVGSILLILGSVPLFLVARQMSVTR